jgi:hypothetical protein
MRGISQNKITDYYLSAENLNYKYKTNMVQYTALWTVRITSTFILLF